MRRYRLSTAGFQFIIAAVAALLAVSGCGDSTNSEGGGGTAIKVETGSLTKAQFIKRADAICRKGTDEAIRGYKAYLQRTEPSRAKARAEAPEFVNTVLVPAFEKQIDQVSSLGAPSADKKEIAAVLEALKIGLGNAREDPWKYVSSLNPFAKASRLGRAYGFDVCGGF